MSGRWVYYRRKPGTTHASVTTHVREHTSSRPPKPQVVQECQSAERKGAQAAAPKGRTGVCASRSAQLPLAMAMLMRSRRSRFQR